MTQLKSLPLFKSLINEGVKMKVKQTHVVDSSDTTSLGKNFLRRSIQVVLAGSMLASGMASAVLLDHGPSDAVITFPQWYRDTEGLALGLCRSTTAFCFPLAANPAGFPGNIGDEAFYSLIEFVAPSRKTGLDFQYRYLGALEASYLPGPDPKRGEETVFARIRIAFNFNDTNKNGTYTVTHPFGVHVFDNVQATTTSNLLGAHVAKFFTVDVPLGNSFDGALAGPVGPFIKWDSDLPLVSGAEEFVGDPNIPHTFTGSPFGTNFIRIQGPVGSNLDGLGNDFIEESLGNVLGQKWTAPIAQALKVDGAYKVRKAGINGVDVWATSTPNQRLIVTGEGMPSLQLFPSGTVAGKYHGHIEYPSTQTVPPQITVTNLSSNPVNSVSTGLEDGVEISQASFDTATRQILVVAHSSDEVTNPALVLEGLTGAIPTVPVIPVAATPAMTQAQCPVTIINPVSVCFSGSLPDTIEPPESISVLSTEDGFHADHLLSINGAPQNPANPPVATSIAAPGLIVSTGGSTELTAALPLDALIIQQPENGVLALVNGVWTFTPNATAAVGTDSFKFVLQAANNAPVSNVATGNLTLAFNATAPTAVADQFAATYAGTTAAAIIAKTKTVTILGNDKPASVNALDNINPASLTIVTAPTKGNLVKLASGQITYVTKTATAASGGADFFEYKVDNSSIPALTSNTARVDITNFSAAEAVRVTSARYTIASGKWVVVGTTSWFGANLTQTNTTCWTGTGAAPTVATLIGTVPVDNTGAFQLAPVTGPVGINNGSLRCKTSNGGLAAGVTVAK